MMKQVDKTVEDKDNRNLEVVGGFVFCKGFSCLTGRDNLQNPENLMVR